MVAKSNAPAALIPVGMMLIVAGSLTGRGGGSVFGLSTDFWAGFLQGSAIVLLLSSIVLLVRQKRR